MLDFPWIITSHHTLLHRKSPTPRLPTSGPKSLEKFAGPSVRAPPLGVADGRTKRLGASNHCITFHSSQRQNYHPATGPRSGVFASAVGKPLRAANISFVSSRAVAWPRDPFWPKPRVLSQFGFAGLMKALAKTPLLEPVAMPHRQRNEVRILGHGTNLCASDFECEISSSVRPPPLGVADGRTTAQHP